MAPRADERAVGRHRFNEARALRPGNARRPIWTSIWRSRCFNEARALRPGNAGFDGPNLAKEAVLQ